MARIEKAEPVSVRGKFVVPHRFTNAALIRTLDEVIAGARARSHSAVLGRIW